MLRERERATQELLNLCSTLTPLHLEAVLERAKTLKEIEDTARKEIRDIYKNRKECLKND